MRRNAALATAAALVAALALGGCSVFKSKDKDEEVVSEEAAPEAIYEPIESVRDIEIGRTRNGYVISVQGTAPGLGYGAPELRARRDGKPGLDGFLDYDFVVQAPDPGFNLGTGTIDARAVRADLLVTEKDLRGAAGVRVHGIQGGLQMQF
jgi:hypothetical protein